MKIGQIYKNLDKIRNLYFKKVRRFLYKFVAVATHFLSIIILIILIIMLNLKRWNFQLTNTLNSSWQVYLRQYVG